MFMFLDSFVISIFVIVKHKKEVTFVCISDCTVYIDVINKTLL